MMTRRTIASALARTLRTVALPLAIAPLLPSCAAQAGVENSTVETIVMIRHAEKPATGLGQLDCQGLNRALGLPAVLARKFSRPDAIYAPDPGEAKVDSGTAYSYVRPLATVEPTAIALDLPVDASIGVSHLDQLQNALERPERHASLVLVAWEHRAIVTLANALLAAHGDTQTVPDWPSADFDRIYIVRLRWTGAHATAAFEQAAEGLDGQPAMCPPAVFRTY